MHDLLFPLQSLSLFGLLLTYPPNPLLTPLQPVLLQSSLLYKKYTAMCGHTRNALPEGNRGKVNTVEWTLENKDTYHNQQINTLNLVYKLTWKIRTP